MRTEEHPLDEVKIMIQDVVRAHPTDPTLQTILGRVTQLHRDFDVLPKTEVKKLRSLGEPSFEYGIYLGPSTIEEDHVIIGFHGVRMEVSLSEELDVRRDDLEQGQLLVLNGEQNIFEVLKEHYQPGEVAEVVNVIKPAGAAEVLEVLDEQETPQLRVQWREVEKRLVTIGTDLDAMRTYVKRGTIVQLDEQGEVATGLVRPTIHVRAGGSEGAILEISDALMRDGVQVGNLVRYDSSLKFAFEKVVSSATSKLTLEKVPDVTYEDIGGLEQVVGKIRDAIELPYIHRAEYREYDLTRPKGILLSGPPGCGKTLIAKAVANSLTTTIRDHLSELERRLVLYIHLHAHPDDAAQLQRYRELVGPAAANVTGPAAVAQLREWLGQFEIDLSRAQDELARTRAKLASADSVRAYFTNIKGPELLSKWVGETERQIRELFDEARRAATYDTPVVIFFDEMEALFRTRGAGRSSDVETTIVPQFLAEIDGVETAENVILIGASNRLDMIDPAFLRPGRFDYKFEIPRPNDTAAREIMSLSLLPTLPLSETGLTPPTPGTQQLVFRTAYRALAADSPLRMIADLGADVRLIQSLMNESDYTQLNQMGPTTTVAQGRQRPISEELRSRLLLLRSSTPVQQIVDVLARLSAVYRTDPEAARTLNNYARAERIAEAIIVQAIDVLYADTSILSMFLVEKPHVARLREFVSGATIDSIVTRAKSYAMKRKIAEQSPDITLADVMAAISEEFDENKAQLAQYFVEHTLKRPAESIQAVEVTLQGVHDSPWLEYKQRPYRTPVRR